MTKYRFATCLLDDAVFYFMYPARLCKYIDEINFGVLLFVNKISPDAKYQKIML